MRAKLLFLLSYFLVIPAQASWVSSYFQWTDLALGKAYIMNGYYVYQIPTSDSLEELRMNYGSVALKQIYASLSDSEIKENNENLIELVKQEIDFEKNPNGFVPMDDALKYLDAYQIREVYDAMTRSDVVMNQRKYGGRGVGFCFGRALVAHNHALIRNVHPASIRKIWVVGNMGFWGHHVSTIVKSGSSWVAIDNFTGIMSVEKWIERMKFEQKGNKELMFFITRAGRFGHETNSLYNTIDLFNVPVHRMQSVASSGAKEILKANDFYQGFFMDFYEALETDASLVKRFSESEAEAVRAAELHKQKMIQQEKDEFAKALKISDVSQYELSQETIYCFNTKNQKLNCNYQLGQEENIFETSVTITGNAQYLIQFQENEKIYAKHITRTEITDESYQIVENSEGLLKKRIVKLVKPEFSELRPYLKVIKEVKSAQEVLQKEVMQIKDILATFNPAYQVRAENASPLVRILNN